MIIITCADCGRTLGFEDETQAGIYREQISPSLCPACQLRNSRKKGDGTDGQQEDQ